MKNSSKVPWQNVHEYLLRLESAKSKDEFLATAMSRARELIPSDSPIVVFDAEYSIIRSDGFSEATVRAYNEYYRFKIPFMPDLAHPERSKIAFAYNGIVGAVDWRDFRHSEFTADFALPNRFGQSMSCIMPGLGAMLSLQRSAKSPAYSAEDKTLLSIIAPHISNLYGCFSKLEKLSRDEAGGERIRELFPRISRREAEIAALLYCGASAAEMASKLFISRRTAEWHLEQIYRKLDVACRREAKELIASRMEADRA
jgi:DNA-binding CsgD family transcriptional regulator